MSGSIFLYNGEVELKFHAGRHAYYKINPDGTSIHVPSVTTILGCIDKSGPLTAWAARMASQYVRERARWPLTEKRLAMLLFWAELNYQKVKERAADIGSMVHDYAHEFAKSQILCTEPPRYPVDPYTHYGCDGFHEWVDQHDVTFLFVETEQKIYSREFNYAGTFDFIALIDNELSIGDYKTSPAIYEEMYYQLAAYKHAKEEETGKKYQRWIIRLGKLDGDFESKKLDNQDYEPDFETFLAAKTIYLRRKEQAKQAEKLAAEIGLEEKLEKSIFQLQK